MIRSLVGFAGIALGVLACSSASEDSGTRHDPLSNCAHDFELKSPTGTVLSDVGIVNVYWGHYWTQSVGAPLRASRDERWKAIANDPRFYHPLQEYMPAGTTLRGRFLAGAALYPDVPATLTEDQFESELAREITSGDLPTRSGTMVPIYVVYLPPGVEGPPLYDAKGGTIGYEAYHHFMKLPGSGIQVAYAPILHSYDTELDVAEGHEVYEAITNPFDDGWRDYYKDAEGLHNELADVCDGHYGAFGGTTLQHVWTQRQCGCVGPDTDTPD